MNTAEANAQVAPMLDLDHRDRYLIRTSEAGHLPTVIAAWTLLAQHATGEYRDMAYALAAVFCYLDNDPEGAMSRIWLTQDTPSLGQLVAYHIGDGCSSSCLWESLADAKIDLKMA